MGDPWTPGQHCLQPAPPTLSNLSQNVMRAPPWVPAHPSPTQDHGDLTPTTIRFPPTLPGFHPSPHSCIHCAPPCDSLALVSFPPKLPRPSCQKSRMSVHAMLSSEAEGWWASGTHLPEAHSLTGFSHSCVHGAKEPCRGHRSSSLSPHTVSTCWG